MEGIDIVINMGIVAVFFGVSYLGLQRLANKIENEGHMEYEKELKVLRLIKFGQNVAGFLMIPLGWFAIYISTDEDWGWKDIFNPDVWGTIGIAFLVAIPTIIVAGFIYNKKD